MILYNKHFGKIKVLYDKEDEPRITYFHWFLDNFGYVTGRKTVNKKQTRVKMHRLVMNTTNKKLDIDHINGIKWDNRKINLRIATRSQNNMNTQKKKRKNPTSMFKGVHFDIAQKGKKPWKAIIRAEGRSKTLGCFFNEIDAAKAYNQAAIKYFGEFAFINKLKE
jgi:hypothetical protein